MKKILFVLVAMVTMSFASCCDRAQTCGTASDSDSIVAVDSTDSDSVALDTTVCED